MLLVKYKNRCLTSAIISIIIVLMFIGTAYSIYTPIWMTNDDIGMSMAAHGYGIAAEGTANIIFSNVVWGFLVKNIPTISGILGYSIGILAAIAIVAMMIMYISVRIGLGYLIGILLLILVIFRPLLLPQFTVVSGLLLVTAIICIKSYEKYKSNGFLFLFLFFSYLSYLIRVEEFILVAVVGAPLIQWRFLFNDKNYKICIATLILAISMAEILNINAYKNEEWQKMVELKPSITQLIDYGAAGRLKENNLIIDKYGYTKNDIDLLANWFFIDPKITNIQKIESMLGELGYVKIEKKSIDNAKAGIVALLNAEIKWLFIFAILLLILLFNTRVLLSWIILIALMSLIGFLGRPGIIRIYYPLMVLMIFAPIIVNSNKELKLKKIVIFLLLIINIINIDVISTQSKNKEKLMENMVQNLTRFPTTSFVNWGSDLPFDLIYPVLRMSEKAKELKIFSLGAFALAPFTNSYVDQKNNEGLIKKFVSNDGVVIVAQDAAIELIKNYCIENLNGVFLEAENTKIEEIKIRKVQCLRKI